MGPNRRAQERERAATEAAAKAKRAEAERKAIAHEIKHDGFRFICRRDGDRVRVFSRRGHDWTDRVPRIAEALAALARNAPFDFKEGRETL
jgi:bifunctional non-homologous end joining protein LigD